MFSLHGITTSIQHWLNANFSPAWVLIVESVIVIVLATGLFAVLGLVLVLMERKVAAHMQIRLGPNRVGPMGMFQTTADTLKLIMKEGLTPDGADKFLFNLAPFIVMIVAMLFACPDKFCKGIPGMGYQYRCTLYFGCFFGFGNRHINGRMGKQ